MAVENWNTNEALNGTIEGVNISEGMAPADLNDVLRKITARVRTFFDKSYRINENVTIAASGGAAPASPVEGQIWMEY